MNADAMTRNVTGLVSECRAYVKEIRFRPGGGGRMSFSFRKDGIS